MWKMIRLIIVAGLTLCWLMPAYGEYYQYRDENGVLRFTDDLASIPPDQRPDIKTHQSIESKPVGQISGAATVESTPKAGATGENPSQSTGNTWQERNLKKWQELDQMQAELKETYEALQAERSQLDANAPSSNAPAKDKAKHNKKVEALNEKIAIYEAQLDSFNEQVQAYNAQVKK
jgi:predicted RNase H-like nuclease (RuvC/YqgF family)